jgi:hypothetical protein
MLSKSLIFKFILGLGILTTLGIGAAGAYVINHRPTAPSDLSVQTLQDINFPLNNCSPIISFYDRSVNEDDFRVYRRKSGAATFALIQILPPSVGKAKQIVIADPMPLPLGTYEYKVSAYNGYSEAFSEIKSVTVDWPDCKNIAAVTTPNLLNPIILNLSLVNNCYVQISYRDNSTNELGLRIYRAKQYENNVNFYEKEILVATVGPHAGIPGTYDDKSKLTTGTYRYRMSAYNASGEAFGNFVSIQIDPICNPIMQFLPPTAAPTAMLVMTAEPTVEACIWEAVSNVFLRKGPDVGLFDRLIDKQSGDILPIIGQSEDGTFWAVEVSPGVTGYITKSEKYSHTKGGCDTVPTLTDPAPPEVAPAPTKKPGAQEGSDGPTISQCSDGVDNDGDSLVDYNPFGSGDPDCGSVNDTSE